ncbi:hypothetical protein CHS0354_010377 [Potamilus streckersoni]|uniref:Uncharacterized protein n=1 Tax=Potamilus streckersoni TaxID=2493646 RepID=A0AAE0WCI1_9BIVA|nr:hypothetical protein CHS0354_010377 [Potamilus streckersoni]
MRSDYDYIRKGFGHVAAQDTSVKKQLKAQFPRCYDKPVLALVHHREKPPSKELLRLFIRSHALRAGQNPNSPWIVDDELVKKHGLPSKFASFLLSPTKTCVRE